MTATRPGGEARPTRTDHVAELHRRLDEQSALVAALQRRVAELDDEVADLRRLLIRSQREVIRRLSERPAVPEDRASAFETAGGSEDRPVAAEAPLDPKEYARLVERTRALVRAVVPAGAVLAVVSRGDDGLVDVDGRTGWHFPCTADGTWAGHHPANSASAVAALEDLRRRGARYLVFPSTARWWLDYYGGLRRHLEADARVVADLPGTCTVYVLER